MINKKASATVVVLIVSVLILSSGLIITNEVMKSDDNIVGTGLVLLDGKKNSIDSSDFSGNKVKVFDFGDSERKSSSRKKSSRGRRSSNKSSQTYNELETINNENAIDNETFLNYNETSENQTIINNTEEENLNSSESANIQFSDGQIFQSNGVNYIVRDGEPYALSSSDFYIEFDPALPSKVCENEKINITVKGKTKVVCTLADYVKLGFDGHVYISSFLYLMEADAWPNADDEIKDLASGGLTYDCSTVYFEETFENIDLSDWIIPDVGGNGEFYAKIEGDQIIDRSTLDYDISVDYNCQCTTGSCCDISSKRYKSSGSQPTGYDDGYYCDGANSPTGTSYCREIDYYCSGNSAGVSSSTSTKDTCGTCEYCTPGDPTCNYYSSSTKCGKKDCDYLDTTCRNYNDANRFCKGNSGTCKTVSCTSYTDKSKHTSCGTNKECDGSGSCLTCTSKDHYLCSGDDVYWYDSCNNLGNKKEDCGEFSESGWQNYCVGNDKWKKKLCTGRGCSHDACWQNSFDCQETFVENCQHGCLSGNCKSDPDIACYKDSDCGINGAGPPWCSGEDVYEWITYWTCNNPGTTSSSCTYTDYQHFLEDCGEDSSGSNYCSDNDVYVDLTDRGCLSGSCFEDTISQFVEDCGEECVEGMCVHIEKPDLKVTDLVIQNINGKTVVLAFTVKNIGDLTATGIYWMVDTDSSDTNPVRTVSASLEPDGWTRVYMMLTYSQSGNYNPEAIVDFDNLISESNEDNNKQTISVSV
jgi:hypothetical protein